MPDIKAIDEVLRTAVGSGEVPGVTAAAANADGVMYEAAFGRRSLAGSAAMTNDTVFRIASMTKAITGAAAMQMVEQGKLHLDQPAGEVLPFHRHRLDNETERDGDHRQIRPGDAQRGDRQHGRDRRD